MTSARSALGACYGRQSVVATKGSSTELDPDQVKALHDQGKSEREIADALGTTRYQVRKVINPLNQDANQ
jgi:DNA invertase Pin-like site-specific DNA recombinase